MLALHLPSLLATALAAPSPVAADPLPLSLSTTAPVSGGGVMVVQAGRVLTRPGEALEDVAILIEDGRILAVGKDVTAPEGAQVVEAPVVCASFLDAWSTVGLDPGSLNDFSTSPDTRTADAWDPYQPGEARDEAVRAGVTAARVQAGPSSPIAGLGAVVRLAPALDPGGALVSDDAGLGATVGVTRGGRVLDIFDRVGEVDRLVGQLTRAKSYDESWRKYEAELAEWEAAIEEKTAELEEDFKKAKKDREKEQKEAEEKGKEFKEERYKEDRKPRQPGFDPDMETLARVVSGEVPLVVEVHRVEEIRALLQKTADFGRLRLVLAGATEAAPLAFELAARDVAVICWPAPLGAGSPDEWQAHDLGLAGRLEEAGVDVLIGTAASGSPRELRMLASLAVAHGLSRDAALGAITSGPAAAFDLGGRLGTVERGKDAELVLLSGDPLDTTARVVGVVTGGRLIQ